MKLPILAAAFLAGATLVQAQVPGLINYQGRLTTPSGAPAAGTRNFSLSIFDSETGGTLLYNEAVGPVTLDATGVYSFQFGSGGASNTQVVETLATTDGTASSFQKVLANTGVVAGSLSVTDGTYTWSQSAGSSNEDDFGVAYSSSLRRVTVTYYSAPPAAGKPITATYRYATSGISGAISSGSQHWMALSIDGVTQTGRQRVLAVPFAMQAGFAAMAGAVREKEKAWRPSLVAVGYPTGGNLFFQAKAMPVMSTSGQYAGLPINFDITSTAKRITGIQTSVYVWGGGKILINVEKTDPSGQSAPVSILKEEITSPIPNGERVLLSKKLEVEVDPSLVYKVSVDLLTPPGSGGGGSGAHLQDLRFLIVE